MNLEKTTSIRAPMQHGGHLTFFREGDDLKIVAQSTDSIQDYATLTEADLRGLVRELFPSKRAPKAAGTAAAVGNGTSRKRRDEAASA